jgi:hypothetical protein
MTRGLMPAIVAVVLIAGPVGQLAAAQPATPGQPPAARPGTGAPPGQTEFVPMNELPPNEQLSAAPLLVTAYSVFLALMIFYVWTVWRRLTKVEAEMRALEARTMKQTR